MKSILLNVLKIGFAAVLIYYLVSSDKLDFSALSVYLEQPAILLFAVLQWILLFVLIGSFRWYLLLIGLRLPVVYSNVLRLQMIGLFFNVAMPGAIGGDIVKAVYVVRGGNPGRKTSAMLSVLVDRISGLIGLFAIAAVVIAINFEFVWNIPGLRPLVYFTYIGAAAIVGGFVAVLVPHETRDPVGAFLARPVFGFGLLKRIYEALRCYRDKPSILIYSVLLSIVIQTFNMLLFWMVTRALTGIEPDVGAFATIFPIGIFVTSLPIAPAGIGVGHVAFENLFALISVPEGANIFNVVTIGMIVLNLVGVIPYLLHRGEIKIRDLSENDALAVE